MHTTHAHRAPSTARLVLHIALPLLLAACAKPAPADAYGNFEADEVVVGAEVGGPLHRFTPLEGGSLTAGDVVAQVDTVPLVLEREQVAAQRAGLEARRRETTDQLQVLQVQHDIAMRTRQRTERLFAQQAATAMQRDQAERDERTLGAQMTGARAGIDRSRADIVALDARLLAMQDRITRATVRSPVTGTVLVTYAKAGEMVGAGQPLFRIASLDTLTLRAYVTGGQLTAFALGTQVTVQVSGADSLQAYMGVVSWVSSRAEFTPTPVQTREDRGDLVYAVKVRVANPGGRLKIGMPADVTLPATRVAAAPSR